jgi:hypothetical protein
MVSTVTSFTLPEEITNLEDALEYRRRNQRLFDSLPKSAPRKMRKAYEERMAICDQLVMKYAEV